MSVLAHADVIVLAGRPGPSLRSGDLVAERRPLSAPREGEVVVRNIVTSVDPSLAEDRQRTPRRSVTRAL